MQKPVTFTWSGSKAGITFELSIQKSGDPVALPIPVPNNNSTLQLDAGQQYDFNLKVTGPQGATYQLAFAGVQKPTKPIQHTIAVPGSPPDPVTNHASGHFTVLAR